jgi:hypothetical protein
MPYSHIYNTILNPSESKKGKHTVKTLSLKIPNPIHALACPGPLNLGKITVSNKSDPFMNKP